MLAWEIEFPRVALNRSALSPALAYDYFLTAPYHALVIDITEVEGYDGNDIGKSYETAH